VANEEGRTGRSAAYGVGAVVFSGGAIYTSQLATASASTFPIWPTYLFGCLAAIALYMCFATIWVWWPTGRSVGGPSSGMIEPPAAGHDVETNDAATTPSLSAVPEVSAETKPVSPLGPPVSIRLMPELDAATNRFRLGALNRGELGRFRVEVIDAHNQNGDWVGPRSWPVPWLEDGSVGSKEIPKFAKPLLDFAHFDFLALQEDLDGTKWLRGNHWVFPSRPEQVTFRYSAVRAWPDLSRQHIVIILRVIRDEPEGHVDLQFKIGYDDTGPYCRELPENPVSGTPLPTDPWQLRDLAVNGRLSQLVAVEPESEPAPEPRSAVTDRWRHTSDGAKVPSLMRLTHTSLFHPGYGGRQPEDTPPSIKIGMLVACLPIDPSTSGTQLRAQFVAFLNSDSMRELVGALTCVPPGASWKNLAGHGPRTLEAALTAGDDPMEGVPVASALFLPPTAGEALYGRDGHSATLVLYVEPRTVEGQIPPASHLAAWYRRIRFGLDLTGAFAAFLVKDLELGAFDDPPSQFGVWLQSYRPLTVMVDIDGLRVLPGRSPSNEFIGWAYADSEGNSIGVTARDLLTQLCEYHLHLDGFDQALDALNDA
jgi:hypothetical protein